MKHILLYTLAAFFIFDEVAAQETIPAEAEQFYQRAMKEINSKHAAWIKRTAANVNSQKLDETAILNSAISYGYPAGLGNNDIMALALLVMMEAAKSAQEDLKSIMSSVKAINNQKETTRQTMQYLERNRNTVSPKALDSLKLAAKPKTTVMTNSQTKMIQTYEPVKVTRTDTVKKISSAAPASVSKPVLDASLDQMKQDLDSVSELGEMESLRLQMMMDRRSKFISTLSNIMKKISDTQNTITQNLK